MSRKVTIKRIKIHMHIDGVDIVEDTNAAISFKDLKSMGAKRRIYKNTKEVFYYIKTNYYITF